MVFLDLDFVLEFHKLIIILCSLLTHRVLALHFSEFLSYVIDVLFKFLDFILILTYLKIFGLFCSIKLTRDTVELLVINSEFSLTKLLSSAIQLLNLSRVNILKSLQLKFRNLS